MAILEKQPYKKPIIDLGSSEGNVLFLIGTMRKTGRQLGWEKEEIELAIEDMVSGDYEHAVKVFDQHLGDYIDLIKA